MSLTADQTQGRTLNIVLAILLFLLGEKSLVLAKLGIRGFDLLFHQGISTEKYVFEVSLVGLAVGTCGVIILSRWWARELEQDNTAILVGLITSTIAAILNIAEAGLLEESSKYEGVVGRAVFFYLIWLIIFILPLFAQFSGRKPRGDLDLSLLGLTAVSLGIAVLAGVVVRNGISAAILFGFDMPGVSSLNGALDRLRFNSDTLVMLGVVWTIVAFAPWRSDAPSSVRIVWAAAYILAAPVAGYAYSAILSFPDGDPGFGVSAGTLAAGFAALSLSAILPGVLFVPRLLNRKYGVLAPYVACTFLACGAAMYLGLAGTVDASRLQRVGLAALQGFAGAMIPVSICLSLIVYDRFETKVRHRRS